MPTKSESTSDPRMHVTNVRKMLKDLSTHLQEDENKLQDPEALALFETSREVVKGLETAFDHYAAKAEKAWKR